MTDSSYPSAKVRLLWDELLSHRVPRALRVLGFNTSHVGNEDDNAPARGSTDREVLDHAKWTNQIIVTSNHDMILLCAEVGERFVWFDPRGKQLSRAQQVALVFGQIDRWHELLTADPHQCVRAMRSKCEAMSSSEAARLVGRRMTELRRRQRRRSRPAQPLGPLNVGD